MSASFFAGSFTFSISTQNQIEAENYCTKIMSSIPFIVHFNNSYLFACFKLAFYFQSVFPVFIILAVLWYSFVSLFIQFLFEEMKSTRETNGKRIKKNRYAQINNGKIFISEKHSDINSKSFSLRVRGTTYNMQGTGWNEFG